jgi:hypothetical protein
MQLTSMERVFLAEQTRSAGGHSLLASRTLVVLNAEEALMLFNLVNPLLWPEAYVCQWHEGELYIEAVLDADLSD